LKETTVILAKLLDQLGMTPVARSSTKDNADGKTDGLPEL